MSQSRNLLLKNGTTLIHGANDKVEPRRADILISGSKIKMVTPNIAPPPGTEVINCTAFFRDKIISPGFVDTHHHVWQTLLKGRHADQTLMQYMPEGNFTASLHSPQDVFWGQLSGCLEMINGGTTSVVDFAHNNGSPSHNDQAIAATASSGIRSVFCYCPAPTVKSWSPFLTTDFSTLGDHVLPKFDDLAAETPWANGRITLGFAFDGFRFLPKERLQALMDKLSQNSVQLITYHYSRTIEQGYKDSESQTAQLDQLGILDDRFLVSHGGNPSQEDADIYRKRGMHVSSTPSTELQMAMGSPVAAFRDDLGEHMPQCCSLGVDCHSNNSAFMPGEARLGLQSARASRGEKFLAQGKSPNSVHYSVEEAFNLSTIRGARAAKMGNITGSIAEGKQADLAIFSATSPGMVGAAQHDPVAAVVLHSHPSDIEYVIIDGVLRKREGQLVNVDVDRRARDVAGQAKLAWEDVAKEVMARRERLQREIEKIDMHAATEALKDQWYLDRSKLVDSLEE
ncbi:hypothetical protein Q7P37_004280 [Cladosporium fusiforme]